MWKEKLQDTAASHPWLEPHEAIKRKTQAPGMQLVDWYGFTVPKTKKEMFLKRFEYRKRAPKLVDLPILLYETAPVQKVTGIIADWSILQASPEAVWTYSKIHSGLTADMFFGYYEGYDKAVAIRIYSVVPFKDSLELQTLNPELKRPPQSFCYVQSELDLPMKG